MTECIDRREMPSISYPPFALPTRPSDPFSRMLTTLDLWYQRARQRRQLGMLGDRLLCDIGLDRAAAREEAAKPFWRP